MGPYFQAYNLAGLQTRWLPCLYCQTWAQNRVHAVQDFSHISWQALQTKLHFCSHNGCLVCLPSLHMQEAVGHRAAVAGFVSTVLLAVLSLAVWFLTRRRVDPNGGILALFARGEVPADGDGSRRVFTSQALVFDCFWVGQVLMAVVPAMVLFRLGWFEFVIALGVYRALSEVSWEAAHVGVG